jgi:hypothetical protein
MITTLIITSKDDEKEGFTINIRANVAGDFNEKEITGLSFVSSDVANSFSEALRQFYEKHQPSNPNIVVPGLKLGGNINQEERMELVCFESPFGGAVRKRTLVVDSIDDKPPREYFRDLILELAKEEAEAVKKKLYDNAADDLKAREDMYITRKPVSGKMVGIGDWVANNSQPEPAEAPIPPAEKKLEYPLLTEAQIIKCKFHDIDPDKHLCYIVVEGFSLHGGFSVVIEKGSLFFKTADLWNDNAPIFLFMETSGHIHEQKFSVEIIEKYLLDGKIGEYSPEKWNPEWDKADPIVDDYED